MKDCKNDWLQNDVLNNDVCSNSVRPVYFSNLVCIWRRSALGLYMRQICCKSLSIYNWNANANGMPIKSLCKFSQLALVQACSLSPVVWFGRLRFSLWLGTSAGMTGYDKEAWQGACGLIWGLCFRFRTNRMTWCACAYDIYLSGIYLPVRDLGKRNRNKKCFGLHLYIGNDGFECLYGLTKNAWSRARTDKNNALQKQRCVCDGGTKGWQHTEGGG